MGLQHGQTAALDAFQREQECGSGAAVLSGCVQTAVVSGEAFRRTRVPQTSYHHQTPLLTLMQSSGS